MVNNNQQCRLAAVTGADGFIGSHLVEALLDKGYRVRAMVQYNSLGSWGWLEGSQPSGMLEIVAGDVRDPDFCRTFCRGADVVFHLAALIAIPYSYEALWTRTSVAHSTSSRPRAMPLAAALS